VKQGTKIKLQQEITPGSHLGNMLTLSFMNCLCSSNFYVANQKQELPLAAIFVGGMERNGETLWRTLHRCLLPSLVPFGQDLA
jgi:hypothetical protein